MSEPGEVRTTSHEPPAYRYDEKLPLDSLMLTQLLGEATELQQLFSAFYRFVGIPVAIIDHHANVLVSSPWRRICTEFHRANERTCKNCVESDIEIAERLLAGETQTTRPCDNGLIDAASAIVIDGNHVANLFIGQFFTEAPDEDRFRRQAEECGFDVEAYLAALREVPIVEAGKVPAIFDLLGLMTRVVTGLAIERKRAIEAKSRQEIILDVIPQSVFWKDVESRYLGCNAAFAESAGLVSSADIVGLTDYDLPWPRQEADAYRADDAAVISENTPRRHIVEPVQQADGTRIVVDTSKVPLPGVGGTAVGVVGIYEDVTERVRAAEDLEVANVRLSGLVRDVIQVASRVVETRDPYTAGHQQRVAAIAKAIAAELGLTAVEVEGVEMAALVHDVGKLSVPVEILNRPGRISDMEYALIKAHSRAGYDILKDIDFDWPIAEMVLQHHERMDGSGYPQGLTGDDISTGARILMVAAVLEASASHRPYRPGLGVEAAMAEIMNSPTKYDEQVTAACLRVFESGGIDL